MIELSALVLLLAAWQSASLSRRRRDAARRMGPPERWEAEDVDFWLERIRPFPLRDPTRRR